MSQPDDIQSDLGSEIARVSAHLLKLDPGPLARLRRMDVDGPGAIDFWTLAGGCQVLDRVGEGTRWLRLVKIMATLTPKGDPANRTVLHEPKRFFGAVLCDGGRPDWPGTRAPVPFLSETRLARFLSLPFERRGEALEGMARMLAASRDPQSGVNCLDIARLLFFDDPSHLRRLASAYYRHLDYARNQQAKDKAA